jgi:hypothetical protein
MNAVYSHRRTLLYFVLVLVLVLVRIAISQMILFNFTNFYNFSDCTGEAESPDSGVRTSGRQTYAPVRYTPETIMIKKKGKHTPKGKPKPKKKPEPNKKTGKRTDKKN